MGSLKLLVCGDVMTGRGVDQVLAHPCHPQLHEPWVRSALDYVKLAESESGPIPRGVVGDYIWGDALPAFDREAPDVRVVNLETAVTTCDEPWPDKGIHYRMHPANLACLVRARLDCCTLANNHVLDWGYGGLAETLRTLRAAGISTAGAGANVTEACAPASVPVPGRGRVRVHALGMESAGVPVAWAATTSRAGVYLADCSQASVVAIASQVREQRAAGDIVVASIHWGGNWGYRVTAAQREFAHALIDDAGVDLVHGHSSHHPIGMETYRERMILYGCGDFLNDYEGIGGNEAFRPSLCAAYFVTFDTTTGRVERTDVLPFEIRRFRLNQAAHASVRWLARTLDRESRPFRTAVTHAQDRLVVTPA